MKPLNIDKTGCSNMSSNCVVWQGPDIECINLCKGDSVTEVVYKLALELCNLMETFDLTNYDLKCFSNGVCQPQNFKDFLNILISKVCALQTCTGCADACNPTATPSTTSPSNCNPNPTVPIAPAFYYTNPMGDTVTTMPLQDYVTAIGNTVSNHVSAINAINATLADHEARIDALESAPAPTFVMPQVVQNGVPTNMDVAVQTVSSDFYLLETATGDPAQIYTGIQNSTINASTMQLNAPQATMSALPGWTTSPGNLAQSYGNLLLTVQDMRLALQNLINSYIPSVCSNISISLTGTYDSGTNTITLFLTGTIPGGFTSQNPAGSNFIISDEFGHSISQVIDINSYLNLISGYSIPLGSTPINASGNITIQGYPAYVHPATGSQCNSYVEYTVVNQVICPAVSLTPTATSVSYTFTTVALTCTYTVKLYAATSLSAPLQGQTFTTSSVQTIVNIFAGLTTATNYLVQVEMTINGVTTVCPFIPFTTL